MTSINIIAKNNCKLNLSVEGNYNVALTGVTGPYNIKILEKGHDYLHILTKRYAFPRAREERLKNWRAKLEEANKLPESDATKKDQITQINNKIESINKETEKDYESPTAADDGFIKEYRKEPMDEDKDLMGIRWEWKLAITDDVITACDYNSVISLVNDMFTVALNKYPKWEFFMEYQASFSKFKFTHLDIIECSESFKTILGLSTGKTIEKKADYMEDINDTTIRYGDKIPIYNGTPYIFLKCNKLKTALRYCWQTNPSFKDYSADALYKASFATVQNIISISPNNNMVTQPFSLGGGQFTCNGNDLTDVVFTITDIYGDPLNFVTDLLWTFELTPLPDEDLSNIPGLFTPEQRGETEEGQGEQQEGEQQQDGQQEQSQEGRQEQQPQEQQQEGEQNDLPQQIQPVSGDEQGEQQTEEQEIIIPQQDGLMRRGLRAIELIGPQPKEDSIMKNGISNVKLVE